MKTLLKRSKSLVRTTSKIFVLLNSPLTKVS